MSYSCSVDSDSPVVDSKFVYRELNTVWRIISWGLTFVESLKRPSKLIFVVLNFVTATSPGAWHCCTSDDIIDSRARDLLCYYKAIPTETWTNTKY